MSDKEKKQTAVCQKNDELTLDIIDIGTSGEGIGRIEGYTLFVKDALVGDFVRVKVLKTKKQYGYARLLEVLKPSPWRIEPVCSVARQCGGCQMQHCTYKKQLEWKMQKVINCLVRIGHIDEKQVQMDEILGMHEPYHYRNKAQFPIGYDRNGELVAGFYAGRSHQIVPCVDCVIQHPCNAPILKTILAFMKENKITAYQEDAHKGLVRHVLIRVGKKTGQVMVCLVINGRNIPHRQELIETLLSCSLQSDDFGSVSEKENQENSSLRITSICLNKNTEKTNVILGQETSCIYGQPYIEDEIDSIRFRISPLSFYQVNSEQTKKLYETALEFADLKGEEVVWDLYCGIGTISLFLARKARKVYGVEIVPQAVQDARENAQRNGFTNTEFLLGAAEEIVPDQYIKNQEALQVDVVTLDPPRKGCEEKLLDTVVKMNPKRIVYVSCDPATLARDVDYLEHKGYQLKRVRACDMFGQGSHVECVVLMTRVQK